MDQRDAPEQPEPVDDIPLVGEGGGSNVARRNPDLVDVEMDQEVGIGGGHTLYKDHSTREPRSGRRG